MDAPLSEYGLLGGLVAAFSLLIKSLLSTEKRADALTLHWQTELAASEARCQAEMQRAEARYVAEIKALEGRHERDRSRLDRENARLHEEINALRQAIQRGTTP